METPPLWHATIYWTMFAVGNPPFIGPLNDEAISNLYIIGCFPDDSYTTDLLAKIEDEQLREDVQSVLIPREKLVIGDAIGKGKGLLKD